MLKGAMRWAVDNDKRANADSLFLDDMPLAELKQALSPGEVIVASDLHQALTELAALSKAADKDIY